MKLEGNADKMPYYSQHIGDAIVLAKSQAGDGWSLQEIRDYFHSLGLSILEIQQIIQGLKL